jgi:1-acyl-sn-glycerol-3-phosphate acyltransferase
MSSRIALLVAAIRTIAAYVAVIGYILLVGPAGMVVALVTGRVTHLYWLGIQGVRLGFALTGIRFVADGTEHVRLDRAAVYAMNHTSNLEPPIIYLVLRKTFPRFQILYKAVLRKAPIMGRIFDIAGFVPIDPTTSSSFPKAPAAAPASCCHSRRAPSSWPSRPAHRSCRWRSSAPTRRCARAVRSSGPRHCGCAWDRRSRRPG